MYIISESENLLERLRLLVQSSVLNGDPTAGDEEDYDCCEFLAASVEERHVCGPGRDFIVLMGRDWDRQVLDTVADVSRQIMSLANSGRILVVKKDCGEGDQSELQSVVDSVYDEWRTRQTTQLEKVRKWGESRAKQEALEKLSSWTEPSAPDCKILDFDDLTLPQEVQEFFGITTMRIQDWSAIEHPKLFAKPPALHWTNYPREAEIQVSFKFSFPLGTFTEDMFRKLTAEAKKCRPWEYDYEWTNGILLREDLVKVTIVRSQPNVVEVTGRIDKDEVSDEDALTPFKGVWKYLAKVLKETMEQIDDHPYLPYVLSLVFIGNVFFEAPQDAPEIRARALDAMQTFSALERVRHVRFKVGDVIYGLSGTQAFPGFKPITLSDIWNMQEGLPEASTNKTDERTPSVEFTLSQQTSEGPGNGGFASATHLNVSKNRGRRVSFGAIRAIPNGGVLPRSGSNHTFDLQKESESSGGALKIDGSGKSSKMSPCQSASEDELEPSASAHSKVTVTDYVEDIVQKTFDEVLVLE